VHAAERRSAPDSQRICRMDPISAALVEVSVYVERIVIRNFRGIKHADITLRKGLNLIVGRNGSGKSTILSAVRILLDATLGRQSRTLDDSDLHGDEKYVGPANVVIAASAPP
jgi:recombinational DNA repair ATPase RecF